MRRSARVDANQKEIVKVLRQLGCTVEHLHAVGKGCPDLLCGYQRQNYLFEIKDGTKSQSKRQLTVDQVEWHQTWKGEVYVIESVDQALEILKGGNHG